MKTEASSTDNYNGCKDKHCKEASGLGLLAVDGFLDSCFLSLKEYRPWFIVHLNRFHPIVLIQVVTGKADRTKEKFNVSIGKNSYVLFVCSLMFFPRYFVSKKRNSQS